MRRTAYGRVYRSVTIAIGAIGLLTSLLLPVEPAHALMHPSFRVVCYNTRMAPDDAIVFPGQPGRAHMHTFYGNDSTDAFSTFESLMRSGATCGGNYQIPDRSAYWIPTLYKNGVAINGPKFTLEIAVYYKRAGGPEGALVNQAFPQGLRMIAGDAKATEFQDNVWFKCMNTVDTGSQSKYGHEIPSCDSDESLIAEVQFPDCWNGKELDSTDHKSHMAFSGGNRNTCPNSHPVKVPKIFMEAKYTNVNGPAKQFEFSSGGQYSFHGDVMSAWNAKAFAALVNRCINVAYDCNPLIFDQIDQSGVTQAQLDAQTRLINNAPSSAPNTAVAPPPETAPQTQSTLEITHPKENAKVRRGAKIQAKPSDGTVTKVEFYIDGKLANTDTKPKWTYNWRGASLGEHTLQAKAHYESGAIVASSDVHVTVIKKRWWHLWRR